MLERDSPPSACTKVGTHIAPRVSNLDVDASALEFSLHLLRKLGRKGDKGTLASYSEASLPEPVHKKGGLLNTLAQDGIHRSSMRLRDIIDKGLDLNWSKASVHIV